MQNVEAQENFKSNSQPQFYIQYFKVVINNMTQSSAQVSHLFHRLYAMYNGCFPGQNNASQGRTFIGTAASHEGNPETDRNTQTKKLLEAVTSEFKYLHCLLVHQFQTPC